MKRKSTLNRRTGQYNKRVVREGRGDHKEKGAMNDLSRVGY